MKVVIIGSGNVATVMGRLILEAGHEIVQVVSRSNGHAALLAGQLGNLPYSSDGIQVSQAAELYLAAVSDSALPGLSEWISLPGKLVVHTAGAVARDVLRPVSAHTGVLYPLQSLRKEIWPYPAIPLLVDGSDADILLRITAFARTISGEVEPAGDEDRLKLHLAGVLVNNFTNHLYSLAETFCRKEGIDFRLLLPLIKETAGRLEQFRPGEVQTGPAIRGDSSTIEKHIKLLDKYNDISALYRLFTHQIEVMRKDRGDVKEPG
ncbi:MAG TPA: Rossmann-like and DUF2520 domain-containing protein [Puia sp.]|nr:Rossmann-like and DUF2520 domain-containing protein [Puia sp.]